jgi:vitamin B12 transporter
MSRLAQAALAASMAIAITLLPVIANAQQPPTEPTRPLEVVVTANRSPTSIQRTGSAITVISGEELQATNPASLADALRRVPGLTLTETGGPGGATSVRLRGNDTRHTLVLIDGVRVNDPTDVGGGFDFASLSALDIERIEVLRGPQSALYGSDAIGGVINIITRRGRGQPRAFIQVEGGSYGTKSVRAGVSGSTETLSYAFALNHLESAGFSRFGHRIRRIEGASFTKLEPDGVKRGGASAKVIWRPFQGFELEIGGNVSRTLTQTDNAFGFAEDTAGKDRLLNASGYAKASLDSFEGLWKHSVTAFAHSTDRRSRCGALGFNCFVQEATNPTNFNAFDIADTRFKGERRGVEYQGDIRLGQFGTLIIGARHERETAFFGATGLAPVLTPGYESSARRTTNSVFALHQFRLGERTDISIGGRMDKPDDTRAFLTWRATAAHRITETGTKLRASVGTGAKAPSLYQQFSVYGPRALGDPLLRPEKSFGYDAGIDQDLFDGRLKLSATVYRNELKNLIDYDPNRGLLNTVFFPFVFPIGQYLNVARATTQGVELSGNAVIVEGLLRARGSFAWQDAREKSPTGVFPADPKLLRRPVHQGFFALTWTPFTGLTIEPSVTYVGRQIDAVRLPTTFGSFRRPLAAYATLGLRAEYAITPNLSVYARGENLTNAHYQEVFNYGTAGRSIYAGVRATW